MLRPFLLENREEICSSPIRMERLVGVSTMKTTRAGNSNHLFSRPINFGNTTGKSVTYLRYENCEMTGENNPLSTIFKNCLYSEQLEYENNFAPSPLG